MSRRPIVYDTETTGLDPKQCRIIEIAAYDPHNEKTFHAFINPGCPIPKEAQAIHGISNEMVREAKGFEQVGPAFFEFCGENGVLIAHNNDEFDRHFLHHESIRHAITMPPLAMFDTLKWARKYRPDLPRHSLQFLRQVYGIQERRAHRALDDVLVLYELFTLLTDDLPIDEVLALMAPPPKL